MRRSYVGTGRILLLCPRIVHRNPGGCSCIDSETAPYVITLPFKNETKQSVPGSYTGHSRNHCNKDFHMGSRHYDPLVPGTVVVASAVLVESENRVELAKLELDLELYVHSSEALHNESALG